MWATAVYTFGLPTESWDNITLAQFHALSRQHSHHREQLDYGFGTVASLIYNFNRDQKRDRMGKDWTHWYPEWTVKVKAASKKTPNQLRDYWKLNVMPQVNAAAKAGEARAAKMDAR